MPAEPLLRRLFLCPPDLDWPDQHPFVTDMEGGVDRPLGRTSFNFLDTDPAEQGQQHLGLLLDTDLRPFVTSR
jgi:hypothetical protein